MDLIAPRMRRFALIIATKAYRPTLTVAQVQSLLGYQDEENTREFLRSHEVTIRKGGIIDGKEASQALASKDIIPRLGPS